MTDSGEVRPTVVRRRLLTGGVGAAGVVAGAVALGVGGTRSAAAADGETLTQGGTLTGGTRTTTVGLNSKTVPVLTLSNASGPGLHVDPIQTSVEDVTLKLGDLASSSTLGLLTGASDDAGKIFAAPIATLDQVYAVPYVEPVARRLTDTRSAADRAKLFVISGGFDSKGRLLAGTVVDVLVGDSKFEAVGAFLNLTATGSISAGFLLAYSPVEDTRPKSSTVNYSAGQTIANGTFAGTAADESGTYVRLFASSTTHAIVDLTGEVTTQFAGPGDSGANRSSKPSRRRAASRRPTNRTLRRR